MSVKYAVNCSILFKELPVNERAAAAKAAGFDAVEFWWPWAEAAPADAEVDAFIQSIKDAGVQLIGLNLFAGDMPGGERGIISQPARQAEFRANLPVLLKIANATGCRAFNALYGLRLADSTPEAQDAVAIENLVEVCKAVAEIGGTVLMEPVSGSADYPLKTAADAVAVVDKVKAAGCDNIDWLADLYHITANGDDAAAAVEKYGARAAHCQIADFPGRNEPGTGELDLDGLVAALYAKGYDGWVAAEYVPSGASADSFGWLKK